MIPKPGKSPIDVTSYRPISLQPTISKTLEKLILKRINKQLKPKDWIPNHQFGFRQAHSTIQQCHRVADTINNAIEWQTPSTMPSSSRHHQNAVEWQTPSTMPSSSRHHQNAIEWQTSSTMPSSGRHHQNAIEWQTPLTKP
jgi:hypothetical protein